MSRLLLVDDDEGFTAATSDIIELLGHEVVVSSTIADAITQLKAQQMDILLMDIMLPDGNGFDILDNLAEHNRPKHIAFITGHSAIRSLIKSVAGPGISYLLKPIDLAAIQSILNHTSPAEEHSEGKHFGVLIGESPQMRQLYGIIEKVAQTQANVMIQGESGTGKELVAQAIHNASQYSGEFVAINCGAISAELIASELFGHEKGAFTGAASRKIGLFERANNGTLFLDEITEMPMSMQPTLLRVLETGRVTRLGGTEELPVNCRVISATNRSTQALVDEKVMREDIYFRLAVFPIALVPLRERPQDIQLLADYFIAQFNREHGSQLSISDESMARLCQYDWPGNIREFRHALFRAFIMTDSGAKHVNVPGDLMSPFSSKSPVKSGLTAGKTIQEMERELITLTMQAVDGDKPKAADMLGISLKTLYNRLNVYESPVDID